MTVVLVVLLAVACVILVVMLLRTRTALERTVTEVDAQSDLVQSLEREADRLTSEVAELTGSGNEQRRRIERLVVERESLIQVTADHAAEVESYNDEIERLTSEVERHRAMSETLQVDLGELQRAHAQVQAATAAPIATPADAATAAESEAMLWDLELARSARTWRYSVSTDPLAESPFLDADDPLKLALEVEAAALREDVGARLTIQVDGSAADAGTALVVLRMTQELLINAAREAEQAAVHVVVRGRVAEISIDARDEDDGVVEVVPPVSGGRARMIEGKIVITADE